MQDFLNLNSALALILAILGLVFFMRKMDISGFLDLFFLRDRNNHIDYEYFLGEYKDIRDKVENLEGLSGSVDINKEIEVLIKNYYNSPEKLDSIFNSAIESKFEESFGKYYANFNRQDFIDSELLKYQNNIAETDNRKLLEIQSQEYGSAFSLRNKMINLFSFSVFAMILSFFLLIFLKGDVFSIEKYIVVISLFLSLGFFVIYIIKSSNSRTSTLMSIYENQRNYQNMMHFVSRLKVENGVTDNDLEVIRMMLVNYSGREKKVSHPYEIILKGLTNSNIQFSGGKMSVEKNSETKED